MIKIKRCLLFEAENAEDEFLAEEVPVEIDEDLILFDGVHIVIPDLNMEVMQGIYYKAEEGCYEADFSLTAIFEIGAKAEEWIYWEQDGITTTLYNYLTVSGSEVPDIGALECYVIWDEWESNNSPRMRETADI